MKYRQGFVSNSSTTSFAIFGIEINNDDYNKLEDQYDEPVHGKYLSICNDEHGRMYTGLACEHMRDDQTLAMFKLEVLEKINKYLPDVTFEQIEYYSGAYYNG